MKLCRCMYLYVLIGLIVFVGLFLFVNHAEGSITYSAVTHRITVSSGYPDLLEQVAIADTAGGWFVFSEVAPNTYYMNNAYIYISHASIWSGDKNKTLIANPYNTTIDYGFYVGGGYINFTECTFVNRLNGTVRFIYSVGSSNKVFFENCTFRNDAVYGSMQMYITNGQERMINNIFMNGADNWATCWNSVWGRNTIVNCLYGYSSGGGTTGISDVSDMSISGCTTGFRISAGNYFRVNNSIVRNCLTLLNWSLAGAGATIKYLDNVDTDTLLIGQVDSIATGYIVMRYGVKGIVKNDSNLPVSGVYINMSIVNISTGFISRIMSNITDSSGLINYTFADCHRWYRYNLLPGKNYSFIMTVEKTGYYPVVINTTLNQESNFTVMLIPLPTIDNTENLVDCTGTFEYSWVPSLFKFLSWANYTGNPCSGSVGLLVHNPNPGNGTFLTNFLQARSTGLTTSIDISGNTNFTMLTEANLGTGINKMIYYNWTNSTGTGFILPDNYLGEAFNVTQSFVLKSISLNFTGLGINKNISIYVSEIKNFLNSYTFDVGNILTENTSINTDDLVIGWNTINVNPLLLNPMSMYCFYYLSDDYSYSTTVVSNFNNVCWYTGGALVYNLIDWSIYMDYNIQFNLTGWSLGGNISWDHIVNLTFSDNASGTWLDRETLYAVSNGTVSRLNTNMSMNDTVYNWRVNWSTTQPSESGFDVYSFTTAKRKQIIPISMTSNHLSMGVMVGCMFGGLGVLLVGRRNRRRSDSMHGGRV